MRCYQRRKCLCCKHCSKCQEFTKVISGNNIDIYIYVKHLKDNTKGDNLVEINGFVFNNVHCTPINTNDLLHAIETNEFNCQRCKSVLIQVSNIIKELIQENKVVVICASCVSRCISNGLLCKFCHKIYDKFITKKKLHGATTNAYAHKWSSEIRNLLSNEREGKKILPFEGKSQFIKTAVSHSSIGLIEKNVDVKYITRALNFNSKSDAQVKTKDLSYLSQTHIEEECTPYPINKILKNHKSLEGFVYVFPKKDLERYDLKRRISSSLLIKEIQEKIVKYKRDDMSKEIDVEGEGIKTFKIKKRKTWNSKHAYIDEEKILSMNKSKTPKKCFKLKEEKEADRLERIKNKITVKHIRSKNGTDPKIKRKENIYFKSSGIANGTNTFETIKNGEESGDGFLNLPKKILKKKNKEGKQKLLSNHRKTTMEDRKSLNSDSVQSLIKIDQYESNVVKRGKQKKVKSGLEKDKKRNTIEFKKNNKYASTEDLKLSRVKIRDASVDNFHIDMVKIKQPLFAREKPKEPKHLSDLKITPLIIQQHKNHQSRKMPSCLICSDSELEIKVDELLQKDKVLEVSEIIMGQKIVKNRKLHFNKIDKNSVRPIVFESTFKKFDAEEVDQGDSYQRANQITTVLERQPQSLQKFSQQDAAKGGIHYKLSNRSFIEKGWTMLPTEKIVRKLNIYRMRPSHPEFDWFEHNKNKRLMHYDTGETLAEIDEDGRGRWFYKNGRLALDYYNAEEVNAEQRIVVYSNGEPDDKGRARPITVLATFDYLGNGIVFDHTGRIRLKYNQTEGVVMDKDIGPVSHWKWHELNDPPVLLKVMIDTQMAVKDPEILKLGGIGENIPRVDNEEMLAIEFDNFIKEKSKKLSQKFKPFQIKMKALKINENFSLRVLDQATVYLTFREGQTNLKLNLGMILDHKEIVDTDTAEVGEVTCNLERLPARTESLAILQRSVTRAQQIEKLRIEHERRFKLSEVKPSVDRLTAAISRPLKLIALTEPEVKCMCSTTKQLSH